LAQQVTIGVLASQIVREGVQADQAEGATEKGQRECRRC